MQIVMVLSIMSLLRARIASFDNAGSAIWGYWSLIERPEFFLFLVAGRSRILQDWVKRSRNPDSGTPVLIRFRLSNFKSFASAAELSLVRGRMKLHPEHCVEVGESAPVPVLRLGLIYGGNASGKSNLCRAIDAAKQSVVLGARMNRLVATPFKLDPQLTDAPSEFEFELAIDQRCYLYRFAVTTQKVHHESLSATTATKERLLFTRDDAGNFDFGGLKVGKGEPQQLLSLAARGTPPQRLFVTECAERKLVESIPELEPVLDVFRWFSERLVTVFPESQFVSLQLAVQEDESFRRQLLRLLSDADTGIEGLEVQEVSAAELAASEELKQIIADLPTVASNAFLISHPDQNRYLAEPDDAGGWKVSRLVTQRRDSGGTLVPFRPSEESAGTRRLLDLFPIFTANIASQKVFVIDEIGRSLHPDLTEQFVRSFLRSSERQSQMILTTHEDRLLDLELVRRDEVWFVEKDRNGASSLHALEEFKPRHDKDIRRSYREGRYGGVPIMRRFDWQGQWADVTAE